MAAEIFRFDPFLYKTSLKSEHEVELKNGEKTIYRLVKGDSELDIRKQREKVDPIRFEVTNYEMVIKDETIKRFLKSRHDFGSLITVFDPLAESTKRVEEKKKTVNLLKEVISFDEDRIRTVGYNLFKRDALKLIKEGDLDSLHNDLIDYAGENPENMQKVMDDKQNGESLFAGFLIASGVFDVSVDERSVSWGDNGSRIYSVPNGVSALEGLVEYFKTAEGREVKKEAGLRLQTKASANASKKVEVDEDDNEDTTDAPVKKAGRPAANK